MAAEGRPSIQTMPSPAGVGLVPSGIRIVPQLVRAGDAILVNGDLGSHGVAVLCVREGSRSLAMSKAILRRCMTWWVT